MTHVERSASFDSSVEEMWERIGDFGSVETWHPAVAECSQDGDVRVLTLGDGGEIRETLTAQEQSSYSYRIDSSPLPVADYNATIAAVATDGGCEVQWSADFESDGASDEEAGAVIGGIFDAGLGAL